MTSARFGSLPRTTRRLFGAGHFAKSLVWSFSDLLMAYYLHVRLGVSGNELIWLMTPTMIYSGVLDVVLAMAFGAMSGQPILAWQRTGAIATAIALLALLAPVPIGKATLLLLLIGFRSAYAVYDVTQNALTSLLPVDEADAVNYVTLRTALSSIARLCVAAIGLVLVGDSAPLAGWEAVAIVPIAALSIACGVAMARIRLAPRPAREPRGDRGGGLPAGLAGVLVAAVAHAAALGLPARFLPFAEGGNLLLFVFVSGTVAGPFLAGAMLPRIGRRVTVVSLTAAMLVGAAGLGIGHIGIVAAALHGIAAGGTGMLVWSDTSLLNRDHARRTGRRADLMGFALLTGTIKLGIAAASGVLGMLIQPAMRGAPATAITLGIATVGAFVYIAAMLRPARFTTPGVALPAGA